MRKLLICLTLSASLVSLNACTKKQETGVTHDLTDPNTVAIVNGLEIPTISLELMLSAVNKGRQKVSRQDLMQGIIENKLIADHAVQEIGLDSLGKNRVGFDLDIALEDQFINVVRLSYDKQLLDYIKENVKDGNLLETATKPFSMTRKELKPLTVSKDRGKLGFIPEQEEASKDVILLSYRFPGSQEEGHITLWDVYRRQNIQGKDLLHKADINFVRNQVRQRLGSLFILDWIERHSGLSQEALTALEQFVFNKHIKKKYITAQGLVNVMHKDNPRLSEVAKTIPQEDITAYYNEHKEEYKLVERARGRQIQNKDEALMNEASEAIKNGMSFDEAVQKYSTLDNKDATPPGDTGWITRKETERLWLQTLLFTQPLDKPSRPFRSPQVDGADTVYWEIIVVDEREESYQAPDSKGVRYEVGKILAEQKMIREYHELRASLFKKSRVQLNPKVLGIEKEKPAGS